MEYEEFEETLKVLSNKVSQFTNIRDKNKERSSVKMLLPNIFIKPSFIYFGIIPIVIILILFFLKPNFVMKESRIEEVQENSSKKKLSFVKLIITTVIITIIFVFVIYIYIYTNNKSKV